MGPPLGSFLAAVASAEEPVPASVSVAALTGAAAAALLALVCRVLDGRGQEVTALLAEAERLRARLTAEIDHDVAAYAPLLAAQSLPRGALRRVAMQQALIGATRSPLNVAAACAEVVRLAVAVRVIVSGIVTGDARAAERLAAAARDSALDAAEENLALIRNEVEREALRAEFDGLRG